MNPLITIWINPPKTFESLKERDEVKNNKQANALFFVTSMPSGLPVTLQLEAMFGGNYFLALFVALVLSGLTGLLLLNTLFTYGLWAAGKLFEGKATRPQVKLVIAYTMIPNLISLAIGLLMVVPAAIYDEYGLIAHQNPVTVFCVWLLTTRIILFGLAFFNKYTYGYAILTILVPTAILQVLFYWLKLLIA